MVGETTREAMRRRKKWKSGRWNPRTCLSQQQKQINAIENTEFKNSDDESEVSETTVENNSEEIEKKTEKKIKRESFLDKLTKNLQDFLDNAE